MTDRIAGVTVTFKADMRADDAAPLIAAIKLLNGVVNVTEYVADPMSHFMKEQAKHEIRMKIIGLLV